MIPPNIVVDIVPAPSVSVTGVTGASMTIDTITTTATVTTPTYSMEVGVPGSQGPPGPSVVTFAVTGNLSVITGTSRLYNDSGKDRTITLIRASLGTPASTAVTLDIRRNGTSLYTTSPKPTVAGGANTGTSVPDKIVWTASSYLTVDVVSIGAPTPGANLTVTVNYV